MSTFPQKPPLQSVENRYAHLLTGYCLDLQAGQRFYLRSTTLAEPLVREIYREAVRRGAQVEVQLDFREQDRILLENGQANQLEYVPTLFDKAMREFDAYLYVMAPFNLREAGTLDPDRRKQRQEALSAARQLYFERTASGEMRRSLCVYPCAALAQEAGMPLDAYADFVYRACRLDEADPQKAWEAVRKTQQVYVDHLNQCREIHYRGPDIDLRFSCAGRTWINSDGRTNMPSGEVFTAPVEDSVNGQIHFSFPAIYLGKEVEGVTLWVKDGEVQKWEARRGQDFLDEIFAIKGARRFGEAAVGTNYRIDRLTRNILFDEKIGGTVHLAIGQSYAQAGGKNQSPIHWDMIADMRTGGEIFADGERIYANGHFLL